MKSADPPSDGTVARQQLANQRANYGQDCFYQCNSRLQKTKIGPKSSLWISNWL